jgi:hypothetical protein
LKVSSTALVVPWIIFKTFCLALVFPWIIFFSTFCLGLVVIIIIIITFSFYKSNHRPIGLDIKYVTCISSLYATRHKIKHIYIYIKQVSL